MGMVQEAQVGVVAWAISRSRTVRRVGFLVPLTMEKSSTGRRCRRGLAEEYVHQGHTALGRRTAPGV